MRLLIVSDLHGQSLRIPSLSSLAAGGTLDILIVCGDITHFGSMEDASRILNEFAKVATTLFIPGNCDPPQLASVSSVEGTTNIHGKCLSLSNMDFIGVGGRDHQPAVYYRVHFARWHIASCWQFMRSRATRTPLNLPS